MANHPINLALRFVLELAALFAYGYWGWNGNQGFVRWLAVIGLPLTAALLWGTFRVPGDPGNALVAVPGWARLILELAFFSGAVWSLVSAGRENWGIVLGAIVVLHYLASYDRVVRIVRR